MKITSNSLDTNVVLRYLLNDIPAQTALSKDIITGPGSYVTDVVVTEVVFVLERVIGMERGDINQLVGTFLSLPTVVYNDYFLDQALDLYHKEKTLSFVDCYASVESKIYQNVLYTFDKQLAKRGRNHVKELN